MLALLPFLLTAAIYAFAAYDYWHGVQNRQNRAQMHHWLLAIALVLHGWLLYQSIIVPGFNLGVTNALSLILWLTVFIYWLTSLKHHLQSLQALILPVAAAVILLQYFAPINHNMPYGNQPLFVAHLAVALIAYALFTFATVHALLMAMAERQLHRKPTLIKLPDFPPLLTMEKLLFRVIATGFVLLTFTLLSGILFSEEIFHQPMKFTHKNLFAVISWLVYGTLLIGHYRYGWRGKTAIRWTIGGFIALILAYLGTKFVLEVIIAR